MRVGGLGVLVVSGGIALVAVRVISCPLVLDLGGVGVLVNGGALAGTGVHLGGGAGRGSRGNGSDGAVAGTETGRAVLVGGEGLGLDLCLFIGHDVFLLFLFLEMG